MKTMKIIITTVLCTLTLQAVILKIWDTFRDKGPGVDFAFSVFKLPDGYGIPYDSIQVWDPYDKNTLVSLCYPKDLGFRSDDDTVSPIIAAWNAWIKAKGPIEYIDLYNRNSWGNSYGSMDSLKKEEHKP